MVFIEDFFRPIQRDAFKRRLFPRQARDKVQIIIQQAVFMTVLALLLHAVEDFSRLFFRDVVHTGLRNGLFELPDIRNVFRMHVIQLFLQKFNLPFEGFFAVNHFVGL